MNTIKKVELFLPGETKSFTVGQQGCKEIKCDSDEVCYWVIIIFEDDLDGNLTYVDVPHALYVQKQNDKKS